MTSTKKSLIFYIVFSDFDKNHYIFSPISIRVCAKYAKLYLLNNLVVVLFWADVLKMFHVKNKFNLLHNTSLKPFFISDDPRTSITLPKTKDKGCIRWHFRTQMKGLVKNIKRNIFLSSINYKFLSSQFTHVDGPP